MHKIIIICKNLKYQPFVTFAHILGGKGREGCDKGASLSLIIAHVLNVDVLLCTGLININTNLFCKSLSIFCLYYLLLRAVILISHWERGGGERGEREG